LLLIITYILFSMLVSQTKDNTFVNSLSKHYKIEKTINFQSKILNIKFAEETGEYVVITEGIEGNILEFYNYDHSLMWQKDIGYNSNLNISENGNTITAYRNSMLEVYDKNGNLLLTKNSYEIGYFLSPNGEHLIDYDGDSP
jgi:hypothetical protein